MLKELIFLGIGIFITVYGFVGTVEFQANGCSCVPGLLVGPIFLYFGLRENKAHWVIKVPFALAAIGATFFIIMFIGVVLTAIAKANLPPDQYAILIKPPLIFSPTVEIIFGILFFILAGVAIAYPKYLDKKSPKDDNDPLDLRKHL